MEQFSLGLVGSDPWGSRSHDAWMAHLSPDAWTIADAALKGEGYNCSQGSQVA